MRIVTNKSYRATSNWQENTACGFWYAFGNCFPWQAFEPGAVNLGRQKLWLALWHLTWNWILQSKLAFVETWIMYNSFFKKINQTNMDKFGSHRKATWCFKHLQRIECKKQWNQRYLFFKKRKKKTGGPSSSATYKSQKVLFFLEFAWIPSLKYWDWRHPELSWVWGLEG